MNIVRLTSGLGNQLFQYAFGQSLSIQNKRDVKYDISNFNHQSFRKLGLTHYVNNAKWATDEEIKHYSRKYGYLKKMLKSLRGTDEYGLEQLGPKYFKHHPRTHNNSDFITLQQYNETYFEGFFISENYFQNIKQELRNGIGLVETPRDNFLRLKEDILNSKSVSLHIRRTDYLNHPLLAVQQKSYYEQAIKYINSSYSDIRFFVFSDDINWAKGILNSFTNVTYMNEADYEELLLMSYCKHNIIANSTFSWWGAWLNSNKDSITVAPRTWYKNASAQRWYDESDLVPKDWIKI